jgi:hypothetical protein
MDTEAMGRVEGVFSTITGFDLYLASIGYKKTSRKWRIEEYGCGLSPTGNSSSISHDMEGE